VNVFGTIAVTLNVPAESVVAETSWVPAQVIITCLFAAKPYPVMLKSKPTFPYGLINIITQVTTSKSTDACLPFSSIAVMVYIPGVTSGTTKFAVKIPLLFVVDEPKFASFTPSLSQVRVTVL